MEEVIKLGFEMKRYLSFILNQAQHKDSVFRISLRIHSLAYNNVGLAHVRWTKCNNS